MPDTRLTRFPSSRDSNNFRYRPLDPSEGEDIRLLCLYPGEFHEPIRCDLLHANLDDGIEYEALSYTWASEDGDAGLSQRISCAYIGEEQTSDLPVTASCASALRRLRSVSQERMLWVDALAIDQSNLQERNHQVGIMARIYSGASQVLVYLGEEDLGFGSRTLWLDTERRQIALKKLFAKRWASRVWVIQEVALAQKLTMGPELGNKDAICRRYGYLSNDLPFSFNDLATFIDMYQQCRLFRAEELAAQLYRLAAIYEAHPTRLKEPFDPKVRAPEDLNTRHVPTDMRRRARKMIRRAKYGRWKTGEGRIACFAWPALVPYESQVEMFQEHFSDAADIQIAPADIVDKCRAVIANAPSWARDTTEGEVDTVTHLSEALEQQHLSSHKLNPKVSIRAHNVELLRRAPAALPILPRGDAELEWLENFAVVAAWMEGRNTR